VTKVPIRSGLFSSLPGKSTSSAESRQLGFPGKNSRCPSRWIENYPGGLVCTCFLGATSGIIRGVVFRRRPRVSFFEKGANWIRPDSLKCPWRVVVGQLATLKADRIIYLPRKTSHWPPNYGVPDCGSLPERTKSRSQFRIAWSHVEHAAS